MASAERTRTLRDIRPVASAVFPDKSVLGFINVRRDEVEGMAPGIYVVKDNSPFPVAFISSIATDALRRERPENVLDLQPLIRIKAYSSVFEVRVVEDGDDKNLKPGAYYRWVRPYGSVAVPVVVESDGNVKILMQQMYRHQIAKFVWELPMGGVNEGESPLDGVKRELQTETGFVAEQVGEAFSGYTDPGTSTAKETFYIAQGLREVGGITEENEAIGTLKSFNLKECLEMIDRKEIESIESIAGIYHVYRMVNEGKLKPQ
jgi:ADP-ribose pyrophosphatase